MAEVPLALYNLTQDTGTVYDVVHQYQETVKQILQYIEQTREDLDDDLKKGKNVRLAAKSAN